MANNQTSELLVFTQEDWRVLDSLEVRNLGALEGLTDEMSKQIIRELTDGLNAGEGMSELSARIQDATGMAELRATTIARTETINAAVDGARTRYEQAGVTEFEYIAASDERTCGECARHNGKIYKLTDNANMPPLHPNCRCAIAPIIGDRKEEILEAEKKRAEEEAKKARREAEIKKKQEEEAQKLKEIQAEQKKKAKEELKKAREEKEAAERKAREAEAARKETDDKLVKNDPLASLARGNKDKPPVIPYSSLKAPKMQRPGVIAEPNKVSGALKEYTGNKYKSINEYLRQRKGWQSTINRQKTSVEDVTKWVEKIDKDLSDKVISNRILLTSGDAIDVPKIYRGIKGAPLKEVAEAYVKMGDKKIRGYEITADEGFQSWTTSKNTAKTFSHEEITIKGKSYTVIYEEIVEPGTPGYYIGAASTNSREAEVLRPRGLINVIDSVKPEILQDGRVRLIIRTHLKRIT